VIYGSVLVSHQQSERRYPNANTTWYLHTWPNRWKSWGKRRGKRKGHRESRQQMRLNLN